ncbi:MAG: GrpB family protein [Dongiaceae bacterium]
MRAITIVDYDPAWPAAFERLRAEIVTRLGDLVLEIAHIGSTAVPGLCAKPKIDIDAVGRSESAGAEAVARMQAFDYAFHGDRYDNRMWSFTRDHGAYGERLYLCAPGHPVHTERVRFRDFLRAHPEAAAEYGALKRRLAAQANGDWDIYTGGKTGFVAEILRCSALLPETDRTDSDGVAESAAEQPT